VICSATTRDEKPCRSHAVEGSTLCAAHLGRARGPTPQIDDALIGSLVAMLRAGNLVPVAARAAGVPRSTLYAWLDRAKKPGADAKLVELRERVERARSEGQVRLVAQIASASATDWRAAAWLLARGYPDEWGQNVRGADAGQDASEPQSEDRVDPFAEIDELARKRQARTG
jgi:hypothetical protein